MTPRHTMTAGLFALAAGLMLAGPAAATDDPAELSKANQVLYTTHHLESINEPVRLTYDFEKKGSLEDTFKDTVEVTVTKVRDTGRKDLSFRFLSGEHYVEFEPQHNFFGNPVFMLFLERDVREMDRLTGGSALYFRSRIRHALAGKAKVEPVIFTFRGKEYEGTEISVQPYRDAELIDRFPRFEKKTYRFIVSKDIPGGFYKIESMTPMGADEPPLTDDVLTFRDMTDALGQKEERAEVSE